MDNTSQQRALRNYRNRLAKRGLARFEVLGLDADRDLIRSLARRLADDGPDAVQLRRTVSGAIAPAPSSGKGHVLNSLRQSPLIGSGIEIAKTRHPGRDIDL